MEPPQPFVRDVQVKRVYITRKTLEKFGYTAGCPACEETKVGFRTGGTQHSDVCRRRIEQAMSEDPREGVRYERAEGKISDWFLEQEAKRKRLEDQPSAKGLAGPTRPHPSASGPTETVETPGTGSGLQRDGSGQEANARAGSTAAPMAMDADDSAEERKKGRKRPAEQHAGNDGDDDMLTSLLMELREKAMTEMEQDLEEGTIPRPVCEVPDDLENPEYIETVFDDISGKELDSKLVKAARRA